MSVKYLTDLSPANKQYAEEEIMYTDFENCTFTNCDFSLCDFTGVVFIDCIFVGCNFYEAKINYVAFRDVAFRDCDFSDVNWAMVDPLLFIVSFTDCRLDYAKFYTLKLKGTLFTNTSCIATDFMNADLSDVIFDNCNLHKAVFIDTTALKTDFTSSYNYTIDPERNKLKKASFSKDGLAGLLAKYEIVVR